MTAIEGLGRTLPPLPRAAPAQQPAAGQFAALLAGHLEGAPAGDPAGWRTVTLGEMIASLGRAGTAGALTAPPVGQAGAGPVLALASRAGPGPATAAAGRAGGPGEAAVAAASAYLGVPYRWGGDDPATGLDCSGLVQRAFADLGVALPRVSADQARAGAAVPSLAEARPGDLVFWRGSGGRPNHIGVYAGGGQMIHAPRTGDVVRLDRVRAAPPDAIRRVP